MSSKKSSASSTAVSASSSSLVASGGSSASAAAAASAANTKRTEQFGVSAVEKSKEAPRAKWLDPRPKPGIIDDDGTVYTHKEWFSRQKAFAQSLPPMQGAKSTFLVFPSSEEDSS
jgi:hypothetical protein